MKNKRSLNYGLKKQNLERSCFEDEVLKETRGNTRIAGGKRGRVNL